MLQATSRPKAATVSKKKLTFSYSKAYVTKFDLGVKSVRATQDDNLNNLGSTCIANATYKVSRSSVYWFWRRRFFHSFYHMWAWQPCWSGDPTHLYKFSFLFSLKLSYEIWFQIAQLFMRKTSFNFEIWMTFDQGQRMTLTFDTHSRSLTHLAKCFKQL